MRECPSCGRAHPGLLAEELSAAVEEGREDVATNVVEDEKVLTNDMGPLLVVRWNCFAPQGPPEALQQNYIFQSTCTIGGKVSKFIIDSGSCENVMSKAAVQKLNLKIEPHLAPYNLVWLKRGASSGIGTETARVLALRGVHVVMGIRNMHAGEEVKKAILKDIPTAKLDAMELDLSSFASVRKFASEFNSSGLPLNLLMELQQVLETYTAPHVVYGRSNNAGIMATPFMLSKDKIELQFATNHLGHFLLTNLLLETMKKTACGSGTEGRIINVSSRRHKFSYPEGIRFDKVNDRSGYNSLSAYGQTKLANILHTNELSRRLKDDNVAITANSVHPGAVVTNLFRHSSFISGLVNVVGRLVIKNVQQGAATTCYVALHPEIKGMTGKYFADCNLAEASSQANDAELAKKLWDFSLRMINQRTYKA